MTLIEPNERQHPEDPAEGPDLITPEETMPMDDQPGVDQRHDADVADDLDEYDEDELDEDELDEDEPAASDPI